MSENEFEQAMADVKPLRQQKKTVPRPSGKERRIIFADRKTEEELLLTDFVEGKTDFEWSFHPAYQEGGPERKNRPLIKKLRRGGFSVQAELDLHGLNKREAYQELEAFLKECTRRQFRCVRIIHGKGMRSANHIPVLKRMLPKWLSTKRIGPYVVAFTSAAPTDGGVGATYVLLRRK
jgi:DNA-nicking Smr family endonuclease